jgi:nicotinate phosphoribosyltransferase
MIIDSLLDTDLYKFTTMQLVLHQFPGAQAEYQFRCRSPGVQLAQFADEIRAEVRHLCQLRFAPDELAYLRSLRFIKSDFVDFLELFHLNEHSIQITPQADGRLDIRVIGPWLHTILFEVPLLSIVNEVYFRHGPAAGEADEAEGMRRLDAKIDALRQPGLAGIRLADYGGRRRHSRAWHQRVVTRLRDELGQGADAPFVGTSNVLLAQRLGVRPLGTMAHEYLQACQSIGPRLRDSQRFGFETWAREYRGDLGIALSDVYGMSAFLRDFDLYFCKLFDGARHDSGDPFDWGERMIAHYQAMRVDPRTKTLIFSDGLTIARVIELYQRFAGRAQLAFGVGTHLTNDLGPEPLQIVMKMTRCNAQPVAKLSDTPGKGMCEDEKYLAYLRQVFEIEAD